jgi:hypothetical protein
MTRAVTSAVPPAPKGMTKRTVRLGQDWAAAFKPKISIEALSKAPNKVLNCFFIMSPRLKNFS